MKKYRKIFMLPNIAVIRGLLSNPKEGTSNQIVADCPVCGKTGHFFIDKTSQLWCCHKCDTKGNTYSLLAHFGRLDLIEGNQINLSQAIIGISERTEKTDAEEIDLNIPNIKLPIGAKPLIYNSSHSAAQYLIKRKFTAEDFQLYHPVVTEILDNYQDYVIIPIYRDFLLKGFVGRYYGTDSRKDRYHNSRATKFARLLMGYDEITLNTNALIIVEGPFDKIGVTTELDLHHNNQIKCVCTFGKKISSAQIQLLQQTRVKMLFFMYDPSDAIDSMKRMGQICSKFFEVYCCVYQDRERDPAELNSDELTQAIFDAQPAKSYYFNQLQAGKIKH